jgi:phage protein D
VGDQHRAIPDCRIKLGGSALSPALDAALARVEADLDVDKIGQCVLVFNDPHLSLMNGKDLECGIEVSVELGFHTQLKPVFAGEIVALEPQFRRDQPTSLRVICQETLHRLALSQATRAFNDVDDKEVVTKIAQEHGLSGDAPSGTREHVMQRNVSDAAFLRQIASAKGHHLRIEGKKLVIGPPPAGAGINITPSSGLRRMKVRIKSLSQVAEVSVHGWDPKAKREIVGKHKPSGEVGEGARTHGGGTTLALSSHHALPADVATAEKMAEGRMRRLAEGFVTAEAELIGNPELLPGASVTVDKLGANLDGTWRIEHAHHRFDRHGYLTRFKAVRTKKKAPPPPQKAAAAQPAEKKQQEPQNWVAIELKDDAGQPMANEPYRITTADGDIIEGLLDAAGKARVEGISPGQCQVTFPNRHGSSWSKT